VQGTKREAEVRKSNMQCKRNAGKEIMKKFLKGWSGHNREY